MTPETSFRPGTYRKYLIEAEPSHISCDISCVVHSLGRLYKTGSLFPLDIDFNQIVHFFRIFFWYKFDKYNI